MFKIVKQDVKRYYEIYGVEKNKITVLHVIKAFLAFKLTPVIIFRMCSWCHNKKVPIIGKILSVINFVIFGVEIASNCKVGGGLFLPHPQGVVIGATEIGINATIYQQVTLGATNIDIPFNPSNRPILGDNVLVASGAKVLGGIKIGNNVVVAANAVVTKSFGDDLVLAGIPANIMKYR